MANSQNALVIGAGISGLACAYRLQLLGVQVTLLEAATHAGGFVDTVEKDGFLFERGPQSFQGTGILLDLIRELGIEGEILKADSRAPRYVLLHRRLQPIPMSPQAMLASSLLGVGSRWKILSEPFRRTQPPAVEESVANFARRKFGNEILEYLVAPFVSGIYAGDPEKLSLKAAFPSLDEWEREYGSVLRGASKARRTKGIHESNPALCSFRRGVGTLPNAMAGKLGTNLQTATRVLSVTRTNQGESKSYQICMQRSGSEKTIDADAVVIATPAYTSAHLTETISPQLGHILSGIAYAPVAVVASSYYERQIGASIGGFGFLVPRTEKLNTLGTVWNSSLFPGRGPEGTITMTSFAGGATNPGIAAESEEEIRKIIQAENEHILKITGTSIASAVWKYSRALPQYNLGHGHVVESIRDAERELRGLFFAGNYLEGPALGKCVENGFQTAEAVQNYLRAKH